MAQKITTAIIRIRHILLHSWDPVGISGYDGTLDEYDRYSEQVFEMMQIGADLDDIKTYLYNSAKADIGLDHPGLLEKSELAAREIIESGGASH
jgi:hypothetical protein